MVQFGVPSVEAAMILGREAADYISGTFTKVRVACAVVMPFYVFFLVFIGILLSALQEVFHLLLYFYYEYSI